MTDQQTTTSDFIHSVINTLAILAAVAVFAWAFWPESKPGTESAQTAESAESAETAEEAAPGAFVLGDLGIKIREERNFTYPATLEEVEKIAQAAGGWLPNPVLNGYDLMYDYYTPTPEPKKPLDEVRKMQNTSQESNDEIIDAFQRIPSRAGMTPDQDSPEVDYRG